MTESRVLNQFDVGCIGKYEKIYSLFWGSMVILTVDILHINEIGGLFQRIRFASMLFSNGVKEVKWR